jgi:hypothetical protein
MTLILAAIQRAPIGMGWRLLLAIVVTVIAIMITKPISSFKSMAGLDPSRHYLGPLLRRIGGTALGVAAGQRIADRQDQPSQGTPLVAGAPGEATTGRPSYTIQPVEPSIPPLPAPIVLPVRTALPATAATSPIARLPAAAAHRAALAAAAEEPVRTVPAELPPTVPAAIPANPNALPPETVRPDEAPRLRPLTVVPRAAGPVTVRPVVVGRAELPTTAGSQPGLTGPIGRASHHSELDSPMITVAGPLPGHTVAGGKKTAGAIAAAAGTPVTYPTGILVQHEPNLYRPGGSLRIEEYLWFPEPQLDANGEETAAPLYRAKAAA